MADNTSVQVALRIRPLVPSEISKGCKDILEAFKTNNQVRVKDSDKVFSYNYVFDSQTSHDTFYNECVKDTIKNLFEGFNVTILAYGQTGSGKTHSMGTAYDGVGEKAVIPRAVDQIFNYIKDNFAYDFTVSVSFMELYQEVLYDLLSRKPREQCVVEIREDSKGIFIPGLTEQPVATSSETLECLIRGSQGRAVGSTNMNAQSSRSHAIFTISIVMAKKHDSNFNKTAKFSLVDLAGSERSKKTGATGTTFKEGVNINKGLLALGNVISALGDEKGQSSYISYRDSNLTRLLKDSLGGNSITLMIACVSPADYNHEETVSTLRYADRARKIKNKPIVNEDPKAAEINRLNKLVNQLRLELVGQGGAVICPAELALLQKENNDLKEKNKDITTKLYCSLNENATLFERLLLVQTANEKLQEKISELREEYNITLNNFNKSVEAEDPMAIKDHLGKLELIQKQISELDSEQKKNQDELRLHEEKASYVSSTTINNPTSAEINERQEFHTAQQIELNNELQQVIQGLAMKEVIAAQITTNNNNLVDYKAMAENEAKISELQKEKDSLQQQLKAVKGTEVSCKLAEQRRKRVQELEAQIQGLNKKVQEQARLIKIKEKSEVRIKLLNQEIVQMKQKKVQLIKSMRQESESFRTWKLQKEKDLIKLKEQDRKRENQMIKMQNMHTRQQNVLKRKVEEAAAVNKRLKDALALRKAAQESKASSGKIEKVETWIQRELNFYVGIVEAKASLSGLLEDRATLQSDLDQLKSDSQTADTSEVKQLEDDIELRSTQILQLQQKILDYDEDPKSKTKWDNIQTMADSKHALKVSFELLGDYCRKQISQASQITELQSQITELENKLKDSEKINKNLENEHKIAMSQSAKDYEEKVSCLLKELRSQEVKSDDEQLVNRYNLLQKWTEDLEQRYKDLETALEQEKEKVSTLEAGVKNTRRARIPVLKEISDPGIEYEDYIPPTPEQKNDPDWRWTPLGKRITNYHKMNRKDVPVKRNSQGRCNCKQNCATKVCGCRKYGNFCGSSCNCDHSHCQNQPDDDSENKPEDDGANGSANSTYLTAEDSGFVAKKPRIPGMRLFQLEKDK